MAANGFRLNEGRALIGTVAVLLFSFLVVCFDLWGGYLAMMPHVMKPTAWLAFALFIIAFTASSFQVLYPGAYGRWAMKNRRYLGLSFALVHFVHAGLVLSNLVLTDASRTAGELTGGGLAYLFLGLMALTSNNASVRWLGPKRWKWLHKIGSYYIWIIFVGRSLGNLPDGMPSAGFIAVFGLTALMLRIAAWRKLRK